MQHMLFSFNGRISRKPYWMFMLIVIVGAVVATIIDTAITGQAGIVSVIFMLIMIWASLAIQVKRWHDRDKSGWWILINFVPIIGPIWAFVENGLLAGTEGKNRFGDNPLKQAT